VTDGQTDRITTPKTALAAASRSKTLNMFSMLVGWLEFNVPFRHKYGYIRDERSGVESYPLTQ